MEKYIRKVIYILFLTPFYVNAQVNVNIIDFGANGKDNINDWYAIQKAIDFVLNNGGGEVYFPAGTYIIKDRSLLVWGSNIKLRGESKQTTKLLRTGLAGWWGELLSISGKSPGGKYFGGMGSLDYDRFTLYKGKRIPSNNVKVTNLTFDNTISYPKNANNIGITNSRNVIIDNCILMNAPQSNIAIVNDTNKAINDNINLTNCIFKSSNQHNVRVISYNQGKLMGNSVNITNCDFENVKNIDTNKELKGRKVHLWYRAGVGHEKVNLKIDNCRFDGTGIITSTINTNNLLIVNSIINTKVELKSNKNYFKNSRVIIENNRILKQDFIPLLENVEFKVLKNNTITHK